MNFTAGQKLHENEVIELCGKGSFGHVYKVKTNDNNLEAIKIHPNIDDDNKKRFLLENKILHDLFEHRFIITPYSDVITLDQDHVYYRMELADYNLEKYLDINTLNTLKEKILLFRDICEGLKHAHENNIVHRDLWWNNILIKNENGNCIVKINDFGRSKNFNYPALFSYQSNSCWGHLYVIPPEYYFNIFEERDIPNNIISDLYSLSIILFFIIEFTIPGRGFDLHRDIVIFFANNKVNDLNLLTLDEKRELYERWLIQHRGKDYNLNVFLADQKINYKVNNLIKKMSNIDYRLRYKNIQEIIQDVDKIFI